jgi:hypothetical protein
MQHRIYQFLDHEAVFVRTAAILHGYARMSKLTVAIDTHLNTRN